jgi:hypothetical protein
MPNPAVDVLINPTEPLDLDAVLARRMTALAELSALCNGKRFTMCVPAQADDTDIVLHVSLRDIPLLVDELRRLRAAQSSI